MNQPFTVLQCVNMSLLQQWEKKCTHQQLFYYVADTSVMFAELFTLQRVRNYFYHYFIINTHYHEKMSQIKSCIS